MMRVSDQIDVTPLLPLVRCPVLVLHADHDARVPFEEGRLLAGAMAQLSKGRGLPAAEEMRCAWQGMSKYLEGVMAGTVAVQDAPELMQAEADACVAELPSQPTPSN